MGVKLPSREFGSKPSDNRVRTGGQIYDYDHYSGANVSLYIGDILIDEITSIRYQLEQTKRPVYGYSSYHWDFMAKGTTIVSGNFTINFKESGYLYLVLKHLQQRTVTQASSKAGDKSSTEKVTRADTSKVGPISSGPSIGENTAPISRLNIERIVRRDMDPAKYELLSDLSRLDDKDFENLAEAFEDQVWGPEASSARFDPISHPNHQRPDHMSNFDIFLTFGNIDDYSSNHTARRIREVELIGSSQLIEISGEPIQEAYSFIARDVI